MDGTVQSYVTSHSAEEGYAGRIEVVSSPSGRRRWPEHVKAEIVLESYRDGVSVADVARKHEISCPQLHAWRRAARDGVLPMPDDDLLGLIPVVVAPADGDSGDGSPPPKDGDIILEIIGVRVIVPPGFDAEHLQRVIAAVRVATR